MSEYDSYLISGLPIRWQGEKIHQPSIKEILEYGESEFYNLITPFIITKDFLGVPEDNMEFSIYDYILYITHIRENFFDAISYFMKINKEEDIKIYPNENNEIIIIVKERSMITKENFDDISNIILQICMVKKQKPEKIPKFKNDRQRDIYIKLMEGRKRKSMEEAMSLADVINNVCHGGESFIPYREVIEMTMYQLYNSLGSIITKDAYNREYQKYIGGADPEDLDIKMHWSKKLKINNNAEETL
jgi:hypothetical protein